MVSAKKNNVQVRTINTCIAGNHIHTSLNSSLCATASKHSCPVLSTESVNSTNSPLSSWIRVTRQLLLETVYLRVLLSFKPNGRGMFHTSSRGRSSLRQEKLFSLMPPRKWCQCSKSWGSSSTDSSEKARQDTSQNIFKILQHTTKAAVVALKPSVEIDLPMRH